MLDATGRIVAWLAVLAIVWVTLRGSLPAYLAIIGV
jgi:hypothetical protein